MAENTDGAKAGLRRRDFWVNSLQVDNDATVTGSFIATLISGTTVKATNVSGTNAHFTASTIGSSTLDYVRVGSITPSYVTRFTTNGYGDYITNLRAEAIISGGMWVMGSAASGTTPSIVLKPAAASASQPFGIATATIASGATGNVLIRGPYLGLIADANVAPGDPIGVGAGAALNTVIKATAGSNIRGVALMGAGSEGATHVYLY